MEDRIKNLIESFGFCYVGGGYFRQKGVAKGERAKIIHGDEIIEAVIRHVLSVSCSAEQ